MSLKLSTGLRNSMLDGDALAVALGNSKIVLFGSNDAYSSEPATADAAIPANAVVLCTITGPTGDALEYEAAAGGIIAKSIAQAWAGTNSASGVATWYRHMDAADAGGASTTAPRVQGTVGVSGAELNLSNTTLANGAPQTIDYYSIALPTL